MKRFTALTLFVIGLLAFVGCQHYRAGGPTTAFSSLYVQPVENESFAPLAAPTLTENLRRELMRDGSVSLASLEDSGATLSVVLVDYDRNASTLNPGDTGRAESFTIELTARVSLKDNRDGRVYFENREVSVDSRVLATRNPDMIQAEHNMMPLLARDLAREIANLVLTDWQ